MNESLTTASVEASSGADAEFVDLRGLEARWGIKRSHAYLLLSEGAITSVVLRRKGCIKGRRLVGAAVAAQLIPQIGK